MTAVEPNRAKRDALRIVTIYCVVAALWINLSEPALLLLTRDPTTLMWLGELKAFVFILITGSMLYALIVRHLQRAHGTESDLRIVQALLEETTDAIFLKDPELRYLLFNRAAARFASCDPVEILGQGDARVFNEEDARALRESDLDILRGGRVQTKEEHLTTNDGVRRTFFVTKGPLYDEQQQLYGLFGIARDITDRKQVEKRLSESETLLRALFDNMQEGFAFCEMLFDADGRPVDFVYLNVNPAFARLTGLTDVTNRRVSEVIPSLAGQHPELLEAYGAVARGGAPRSFDIEFRPLERWLSLSIYSTGSPYFAVVFEDITERKRTEEALRETSQRLLLANEAAGIGIWDWDVGTGVVVLDDRMDALYGQPSGTLSKGSEAWMGAIHADDRQRVREGMEAALLGKAPLELRLRVPLDDGGLRTLDITGTVMRNEDGAPVRVIGICRDITDTLALEAQLRQAQKMEAVGRLAGGVAHDFNNMLTAIMGYGELLQSALERNSPLRAYVDEMLSSAERAATLTRDLLAFSRRQIMRRAPLEVNAVLHGLKNMLARVIGDDIVLDVVTPAHDIVIMGDRSQLENVLINLAINARDAMDRGGTLTLSTRSVEVDERFAQDHPEAHPGPYAVISVRDTGHGIEPSIQNRIFEPFFTTKEVGRGTGLGLAMVYGTIRQHEGFIEVCSAIGDGTLFELYLPRSGEVVTRAPVPPTNTMLAGRGTVLLVEDNASVRRATRAMLTSLGYDVVEAADGMEAEVVFEQHRGRVDLLFTDVSMPHRGGVELASVLRRIEPTLKVLFVSGNSAQASVAAETDGQVQFMQKPLRREALSRKLQEMLAAPARRI